MNDQTQLSPLRDLPDAPPAPGDADTARSGASAHYAETFAQTPSDAARAATESALPPLTGPRSVVVPGYEIIGELGRGGMGVVYKARQVKLNRVVALKMVLAGGHADSREIARFVAEAEAVAAIRHPHVIQVFDSGEAQGHPYMAMECLEGGSLVARLRAAGKMEPEVAAELVMKVARGVQAAHDRGIVHRDLKPHNVLLDAPPPGSPPSALGEPKVMDFGLAKRDGADLTQTGAVMGTPAYMSPEQARGETKNVGPLADVYALGVILYECLCGSVPFKGADAWSVIRQVVGEEPEPVTRRMAGVPRDLDLVCRKCLAKEPAERYASAAALADDLQLFLNGEAIRGARTGVWYAGRKMARRWWRRWPAAAAVVLAVVATWAVASRLDRGQPAAVPAADKKEDEATIALRAEVTARVATLRQTKPHPERVSPHPVTALAELPAPDFSCFKTTRDERVVDMRGWRPVAPGGPGPESSVVFTYHREFMKVAPADELRVEARTTGVEVVNKVLRPNPTKARVFTTDKPGFVGDQSVKVRHILFDVSDIAVGGEFALRYTSTHWNSHQTDADRWVGVTGYPGAVKTSVLLLFPDGRPFHDYQIRFAPTRGNPTASLALQPYTGPLITLAAEDKSWLYCQIPSPKEGHFYRVDWAW